MKCLAVCRQCTEAIGQPLPVPFDDIQQRDDWIRAHAAAGHEARPVDGWPSPVAAWVIAFPEVTR